MAPLPQQIRFSIVTPTRNAERYLSQTISSVISQQGDFEIEYLVVDGQSTDRTLEIAKAFLARLERLNVDGQVGRVSMKIISQRDNSMYEAINRGFAAATGNVYAWLNADDLYLPGALQQVARIFAALPHLHWLKGVTSYIDDQGEPVAPGKCYLYAQNLIRQGLYGREAFFIQQDSLFWRARLWQACGGLDVSFHLAGDYELWTRFARHEPLYSVNLPVSCFRRVEGQLSENLGKYRTEQKRVARSSGPKMLMLRLFFRFLEPRLPDVLKFPVFRLLCPCAPLYLVKSDAEPVKVSSSFGYMA